MKLFHELGFMLLPGVFSPEEIDAVLWEAKEVFHRQFLNHGYTTSASARTIDEQVFNDCLYRLFEEDLPCLMNCGKQIQHLISLHRLSLDERLIRILKEANLRFPNICTRPVLTFHHPKLASEPIYFKVDAHQDWRSMQGSVNSVVIWMPLAPLSTEIGPLHVLPGSHLRGLLSDRMEKGFGMVTLRPEEEAGMIPLIPTLGDVVIFSSLLVHKSGENKAAAPRWSCHFRYNDLDEKTFIERGYCHPYLYKPVDELLTPNFLPRLHPESE